MRIRRLSAFFWMTCIIAFIFILYVMTDLSFNLPSVKPAINIDENKWSAFESKLRHIENELDQHHAVVGEIKSAMSQIIEQSNEYHPPQKRPRQMQKNKKIREFKVVRDEPPRMHIKLNESTCPIQKFSVPKTDVQMLSLYERIMFDDKDGGVWKQGWNIEYNENQWSQKNKLKVFIVPHSHNDPGWLKTFENYYKSQTRAIFNNMIEKLNEGVGRKFIWAEISFLSLWWNNDATEKDKTAFLNLLKSKKLEIVTGGWVMNDEANSHWLSVVQQLTTGHQWLLDNLGYVPKNAWSIDPFGYSSAQPYLLKIAGFDNSMIQRVHYRIKKELASNRQLEFRWRQLWDGVGKTDMFTHLFPFYSYDVPHSCGPDPKICCQFDFKRLPGNGVTCPWGVAPQRITQKNVDERAFKILDQWRKKAQLYRSNVLFFPLGDDFRYDRANEWDNQYQNYDMLIEYINSNDAWNTEVQYGTLEDYFKALHDEVKLSNFPVLSGDFFTYADRNQHYWSGYYTSRPFYKNMDRVLLAYVRAAEIITAQATDTHAVSYIMSLQLRDRVEQARRSLSLFQHHDGITGTSRDEVREDYAKKMLTAIKYSQSAIQQAAYYLLKQPHIQDQTQEDIFLDVDDIWRRHDEIPSRITIALDVVSPSRRLVLYNALAFRRQEILTVLVSTPHVEVFDPEGEPIMAQVSPVVAGERRLGLANNKYQLSFPVTIGPLALTVYSVSLRDAMSINKYTSFSHVRIYNADYWSVVLPKMFPIEQPSARLNEDVSFQAGNSTRVVTNMNGLVKTIVSRDGVATPVHMDFVQYDTQKGRDNNSGAYLFIPSGPAKDFKSDPYPEIVVTEGIHKSTLYAALVGPKTAEIILSVTVYNNPSLPHAELEVSSALLIDPQVDDLELALRLSTSVRNGDVFYTDLNGMQMIKRRYFEKIPLQANFYPLPAAAYIEDENIRFTVLTSTPLGMAALQPGQIEIGRSSEPPIDFVVMDTVAGDKTGDTKVLQSTISRFACRIIADRNDVNNCRIYAAGFDSSRNIFLGEKATKWTENHEIDGLTTNGVLIMHPRGDFCGGSATCGPWRETSVGGAVFSLRESRSAQQKGLPCQAETNVLRDGTMIDLCGATLLWRSAEGLKNSPTKRDLEALVDELNAGRPQCPVGLNTLVIPRKLSTAHQDLNQPYVYLNCGHVQGEHSWGAEGSETGVRRCPMCLTAGPVVRVCMGIEPAFYVDAGPPTYAFNPCGHMASERTVKYWANVDIPHGTNGFHAICPFCAAPLQGSPGYVRLIFQDNLD